MKKIFLILVFLLLSVPAFATTRYVAKTGSNSNSCATSTSMGASAKLTIAAGVACMAAGDTLFIQAGTYAEELYEIFATDGSAGAPYTISSYSTDHVIIKPTTGSFVIETTANMSYLTFKSGTAGTCGFGTAHSCGLTLDNSGNGGSAPVRIFSDHVTFTDVEFTGGGNDGGCVQTSSAVMGQGRYLTLTNSYIHACGVTEFDNGVYIRNIGATISGNEIGPSVSGAGIQIYNAGSDAGGALIKGNYVHDNGLGGSNRAQGIILYNCFTTCTAYNNIIDSLSGTGSGGAGILVGAGTTLSKVLNNTCYNMPSSIYCILNESGAGTGNVYQNNAMFSTLGFSDQLGGATNTNNTSTASDPGFTNAAGGNFTLLSTSPLIDTGVDLSATLNTDIIGVSRPSGSAFDRGAYEFNGGNSLPPPSTIIADSACTNHGNDASSLSFSCTVGDHPNRESIFFVAVATDTGTTITTPTFNGVSVGSAQCGVDSIASGTELLFSAYVLKAPDTGTHTFSVSFSDAPASLAAAMLTFYNVDQTTPYRGTDNFANAGTSSVVTVPSAAGDMLVDGVYAWGASTLTPGSAQTALYNAVQVGTGVNYMRSSDKLATGTSTNMTWTFDVNSGRIGACGFSLIPNPTVQPNFKNIFASPVIR